MQRVLLLIFLSGWICCAHGGKSQNPDNDNVLDNVERAKIQAGEGKAAAAADGASSIRRSGAWKLAEEAACREDVIRICPKHSWNNNLAVLECLQDRKDVSKHVLTESPRLRFSISVSQANHEEFVLSVTHLHMLCACAFARFIVM